MDAIGGAESACVKVIHGVKPLLQLGTSVEWCMLVQDAACHLMHVHAGSLLTKHQPEPGQLRCIAVLATAPFQPAPYYRNGINM